MRGVLAAGRAAEDSDPGDVHVRFDFGKSLGPADSICEAAILEVTPADLMEFFSSVAGTASVHLDHIEAAHR